MLLIRSALAYIALVAAVFVLFPGMAGLGAGAVSLAVILGWRDMRRVPRAVFLVAVLALVFALGRDPGLIGAAAGNMSRLAGLVLAVMLLSSVLGRTRDLQQISSSLFGGNSSVRYLSLSFGTSLVSVPLNFGSVAVVGSLVGERVRSSGDSPATRNATRAVLRGFGVSPTFSPLSISVVLTLTLLPGLGSLDLLLFTVPFSAAIVLCGLIWREPESAQQMDAPTGKAGLAPWLRFGALILAICAGVFLLSQRYQLSYAHAVTLSCLAAVLGARILAWSRNTNPPLVNMSNVSNELAIVGGSAFIGSVISGAVLGQISGDPNVPAWLWPVIAACVPWVFFAAGLAGINPIVIGTLAGGILGAIWPGDALIGLGIGMVTGWGITAFGTPFAANALIMERLTGYRAMDASFRWNLRLSLVGLTAASLLAAVVTVVRV
ncbi:MULTISPECIES: hypothetical protein [unclassified Marinobacter]|uniref:hypothetical protein n=1 Tax=unclassified Marinobacter TaxID=83889 RepID=UPI0026E1189F|nr:MULTISPECIES: hypothetical protein [unclassified Marinobacter]MDO6441661.1 hypothetical protein [Marinobacter sp. 2_MG-2023]MDO6822174.1 hypothetical protein [Marinobacter sp. 1_MG-2023]